MYNNTVVSKCQVLSDKTARGKERPWKINKLSNGYIALAYDEVDPSKANRMRDCASWLEFEIGDDNVKKLHNANFCRVRLCPICAWRRSLKTFGQVSAVVEKLADDYKYVFLTLTVRNCSSDELSDTITHLNKSFDRMTKYVVWKKAVKGYFRSLEVTHNTKENTYHPHYHCLLCVNKSYFTSRNYISQNDFTQMWKKALKIDYTPIVHVESIKHSKAKAIAEVAKYSTKASEIICFDDWDLTVETVRVLDAALANRRLTTFSGVMRDVHKKLHLDDSEDGDLVHTETEQLSSKSDDDVKTIAYVWHSGYNQYVRE